jgi:hypothetical protein
VTFAPGDSFGDRIAKISDWKTFATLECAVFNPGRETVNLTLTVKHKRTTNYQTRVDAPIALKPGRNDVRLGLDTLTNVNGSAPDLARVERWYLACAEGQSPVLWFSDLCLVGEQVAATPVATPAATTRWRVRGKIGDLPVDLLVTPELGEPEALAVVGPAVGVALCPERAARLKDARMPAITAPTMFNTPQADAVLTALEVFPPDSPWNQLVSDWPVHPNSRQIVASVGLTKPLRYNPDMGFVLVPPDQKRIPVTIADYPGESDPGPYPLPDSVPIEGWPVGFLRDPALAALTLDEVQRDRRNQGGDRHGIVVDPVKRMLYEFFQLKRVGTGWQAAQASIFDLKTNKLRPTGWTSADAAGLPIFPSVVRYDELQRGRIDHALRVTVRNTRRAFVAPATHHASRLTDENLPRMGERFRLRRDFDLSGFSPEARTILVALQRYGMLVADNGIEWAISVAPDERIPVLHEELRKVKGSDFEVVVASASRR